MPAMKRKITGLGKPSATVDKRKRKSPRPSTPAIDGEQPKSFATAAGPSTVDTPEAYPYFSQGRVIIQLCNDPKTKIRLHRAVLERNSSWFAKEFANTKSTQEGVVIYNYILAQTRGQSVPTLLRTVRNAPSPAFVPRLTSGQNPRDTIDMSQESINNNVTSGAVKEAFGKPVAPPNIFNSTRKANSGPSSAQAFVDLTLSDDEADEAEAAPVALPSTKVEVAPKQESRIKQEPQDSASALNGFLRAETTEAKRVIVLAKATEEQKKIAKQRETYQEYVEAYNSLFSMFYNILPRVSAFDIDTALTQCENIIRLAKFYGSLPTVRPYLGNLFAQFRKKLFLAIANNPPRWLLLSLALESGSIFCEALIHCAGSYPFCPWKPSFDVLPATLRNMIIKKAEGLGHLRSDIHVELLANNLSEDNESDNDSLSKNKSSAVTIQSSPESWLVVQIVRDWIAGQISHHRNSGTLQGALFYRLLAKGGDAYLPVIEVRELLEKAGIDGVNIDGEWEDLDQDLEVIKNFNKQAVGQLVVNYLMVDAVTIGIPYLTCVEVGQDDYPWIRGSDDKAIGAHTDKRWFGAG